MEKTPPPAGKLWLVGAGPGDPDLLTLRAARLIESADLVVHDGLVGEGVLALIPAHVTRISVAKQRRSEEHTSELQSLMRISYAVFCLKKKNTHCSHFHSLVSTSGR